jgi:superfamily II DNA or RNA helicase
VIELFPDQQEALDKVLAAFHKQPVSGKALVVAPTAWGKTIFFSALIHALQSSLQECKPVLIIAHRDELLDQAREKYQMFDSMAIVGKVGGGCHEYGAPITVAGIDTISGERHLKNLHKFGYGLVIVDECHHAPAPKYLKVRQALPDAFWLGVTATPDRLDGKSLEPLFGLPVFSMTIIEAIQKKRLCDVRVIAIRTETDLDDVKSTRNTDGEIDFNLRELEKAIDTLERNKRVVESYQEHAFGRLAICFCVSVQHAESLAGTFNNMGVDAAVVKGSTTKAERHKQYNDLRTGKVKVLCSVQVLTEGFDLPAVNCVIMARPTQSRALYVQCVGRGLRLAPGKKDCLILDLTDNSLRLRLSPQSLHKALNKDIKPDETLLEALDREEDEKAEREATEKRELIRRLNHRRDRDITINPLGLPEWQENDKGMFVMEVGLERHRIALVPYKGVDGWYEVWARLAPDFEAQKWMGGYPLDAATQYAEKRAHMLIAEPTSIGLVDKNAAWRDKEPSEKQLKKLRWYKINIPEGLTRGQASDLIDAHEAKKAIRDGAKKVQQPPTPIEAPKNNLNGDRVFRMLR